MRTGTLYDIRCNRQHYLYVFSMGEGDYYLIICSERFVIYNSESMEIGVKDNKFRIGHYIPQRVAYALVHVLVPWGYEAQFPEQVTYRHPVAKIDKYFYKYDYISDYTDNDYTDKYYTKIYNKF